MPPGEAYRVVSPDYFSTALILLKQGRLLTPDDRRNNSESVVINEAMARKYFPNGGAIGEQIYLGSPELHLFDRATIVGIVGNTHDAGLRAGPLPEVFAPHAVMPYWSSFSFMVRTTGEPTAAIGAVRHAMREVAPTVPLRNLRTMDDILRNSVAPDRLALLLLGALAAMALLMAAIGVFGVLSYLVAQRRRELGIRMALGATPAQVQRMVVGEALCLAGMGATIGLGSAIALSRVMQNVVLGVKSTDPITYLIVTLTLLAVGVSASCIPARRATRVSPMVALRDG